MLSFFSSFLLANTDESDLEKLLNFDHRKWNATYAPVPLLDTGGCRVYLKSDNQIISLGCSYDNEEPKARWVLYQHAQYPESQVLTKTAEIDLWLQLLHAALEKFPPELLRIERSSDLSEEQIKNKRADWFIILGVRYAIHHLEKMKKLR
jgi:hypothetical protein